MSQEEQLYADLEGKSEKELLEIIAHLKLTEDFPYFSEKILKVQTMKGKIVPFALNFPQLLLHDIIENYIKPKRLIRLVILKARRMGFSTYFSGRFYQRTSRVHNRYAAQITHEPEATDTLFKMVKRFYNFSPPDEKPETLYNNTRLLEFNTKDGKGLNSAFRVCTAGKEDFGSGQTINYAHLCLHPDTPVLVEHGREKRIADLQVGDIVLTHNGNVGRVSHITRTTPDMLPDGDKALSVHTWLGEPVTMTPQHKVYTNMGWIEAGDLEPGWHFLSMPIRKITNRIKSLPVEGRKSNYGPAYKGPTEFPFNEDTGFAMGYYLAEGCLARTVGGADTYHRIVFTLHQDEDSFAERACAALAPFCKSPPKKKSRLGTKTRTFTLDSGILANFINSNFGCVDEKRIPDWVFDCGEDFCRGIVVGYLAGDGSKGIGGRHQNYDSNSICASSIRESITYQIRDLVGALGYGWGGIRRRKGGIFYGRNCLPQWTVYFSGECGFRLRELLGIERKPLSEHSRDGQRYRLDFQHNRVWLRIKKIEKTHHDEFYDIEVDHEDHSFRTPHFAVSNSEVSKWDPSTIESLLTSILQTVPDEPDTAVVFESTAKGIGGEYYDRFWDARYRIWIKKLDENGNPVIEEEVNTNTPEDNIYTSIFFPWFVFPDYRMPVPPDFVLTQEEAKIKIQYGLDLEQMFWRRWTIANKCNGSVDTFNQEYPACPEHAFLGSGRPVFDNAKLLGLKEEAPAVKARYECLISSYQWISKDDGRLWVWEEPKTGGAYIISADVSEGLKEGDYSVADVIDHRTGMQVAQWHGKIDPDAFALTLIGLGRRYNMAWIAPERNNHGLMVVTVLVNENYPRVYSEMVPEPPGKPRKRYGWVTNNATRPLIIDNLIKEVREDTHGIRCAKTLEEMMSFKIQDNGRMEADVNRHDDRVISYAIGKHLRQILPLPSAHMMNQMRQRQSGRGTKGRPNPKGWT
jgi:hypothetical protein